MYKKYLLSASKAWLTAKVDEIPTTASRYISPMSTPLSRLSGVMKKLTLETLRLNEELKNISHEYV